MQKGADGSGRDGKIHSLCGRDTGHDRPDHTPLLIEDGAARVACIYCTVCHEQRFPADIALLVAHDPAGDASPISQRIADHIDGLSNADISEVFKLQRLGSARNSVELDKRQINSTPKPMVFISEDKDFRTDLLLRHFHIDRSARPSILTRDNMRIRNAITIPRDQESRSGEHRGPLRPGNLENAVDVFFIDIGTRIRGCSRHETRRDVRGGRARSQ